LTYSLHTDLPRVKLTELHSDEYFPTCLLRQPANPSANARIISSIIQVSHAHA
jgi:hypothetical protein